MPNPLILLKPLCETFQPLGLNLLSKRTFFPSLLNLWEPFLTLPVFSNSFQMPIPWRLFYKVCCYCVDRYISNPFQLLSSSSLGQTVNVLMLVLCSAFAMIRCNCNQLQLWLIRGIGITCSMLCKGTQRVLPPQWSFASFGCFSIIYFWCQLKCIRIATM